MSLAERKIAEPTVSLSDLLAGPPSDLVGTSRVDTMDYINEIVWSGLPGIRALPERFRMIQLESYVDNLAQHDLVSAGFGFRNPGQFRRWFAAFAAVTGTTTSFTKIARAAVGERGSPPARETYERFATALYQLRVLEELDAWVPSKNPFSRLSTSPVRHLMDPALVPPLLGLSLDALIGGDNDHPGTDRDDALLGRLFESLLVQSVRVYAQAAGVSVWHFRTRGGEHEVDIIVERRDRKVLAIEVKMTPEVDEESVEHLVWLRDRLGGQLIDAIVVTTGNEAYRRPDGIGVVPAALLGP